jgi:Tfp pilus assembly protein PilO
MAALEIQGEKISVKQLRPLMVPVAALFLILILFVFGITQALKIIDNKKSELGVAEKDERTLEQKQEVLTSLSSDASSLVEITSSSLPEKNASLMMISQVKELAAQRLLAISDLKIGRAVEDGALTKAQLQFDVDGDLAQVSAFIRQLAQVAPLSRLGSVKVNQSGDVVRANVTISVYSAKFPEKLPAINEPLSDLSEKDREILGILTELTPPPFSSISPQAGGGKVNPFE